MSFSNEWDERYRENTHLSIWPWSDLVSYVMRYARPTSKEYRVLELGCGAGANIPFFQHLGVDYHAVEGSPTIVEKLREQFPRYKDTIVAGDFTRAIPFAGPFDLIVDRAALTHNPTRAITGCLALIKDALRPGGKFIGIDWFSTEHFEYRRGLPGEDEYTRTGYTDGSFAHVGNVHFADARHLRDLFAAFSLAMLELKTITREVPADNYKFASWNLVARKGE